MDCSQCRQREVEKNIKTKKKYINYNKTEKRDIEKVGTKVNKSKSSNNDAVDDWLWNMGYKIWRNMGQKNQNILRIVRNVKKLSH